MPRACFFHNVKLRFRSVKSKWEGIERVAHRVPVNRKYLEMPVAFREKTQFTISCVQAYIAVQSRVRTDKEEKIKVLVDAGAAPLLPSANTDGQAGRGGQADGKSMDEHAGTSGGSR